MFKFKKLKKIFKNNFFNLKENFNSTGGPGLP
jgi:hypothetical protein